MFYQRAVLIIMECPWMPSVSDSLFFQATGNKKETTFYLIHQRAYLSHERSRRNMSTSPFTARLLSKRFPRTWRITPLDNSTTADINLELTHRHRGLRRRRVPPSSILVPACLGMVCSSRWQLLAAGGAVSCCRVKGGDYLLAPATKLLSRRADVFLTASAPKT